MKPYFRVITLQLVILLTATTFWSISASAVQKGKQSANNQILKLKVGYIDYRPYTYYDEDSNPVGIFIDIMRFIAESENWDIEYIQKPFSELIVDFENEKIDVLLSLAYTEERQNKYFFNNTNVIYSWAEIVVRDDSDISSIPDLAGKKIGSLAKASSTTSERGIMTLNEQFGLNSTILTYATHAEYLQELLDGNIDAAVVGMPLASLLSEEPGYKRSGIVFAPVGIRMGVRKSHPRRDFIASSIDRHLDDLKENPESEYYRIMNKYMIDTSYVHSTIPNWLIILFASLTGVLLLVFLNSVILKKQVADKTSELNELNNKLKEDIKNRKITEQALLESETKFREIFNNTYGFQGLLNPDGTIITLNRPSLELINADEKELIGKPFWETAFWAHNPDFQKKLRKAIARAQKGEFVQFEATHSDAAGKLHYVDFSLKPMTDASGNIVMLIPEGRDITEKKEAEESLTESEGQYRKLFENAYDLIFVLDKSGRFIDCNKTAEDLFGYTKEEILGKTPEFISPEYQPGGRLSAPLIEKLNRQSYSEDLPNFEWVFKKKDGTEFWAEVTLPVYKTKDEIFQYGIVRDISAKKKHEMQLLDEKNRLESVINSIPDPTVIVNKEREILSCNPAFTEVFGFSYEDIAGKTTEVFYADKESYDRWGRVRYNPDAAPDNTRYLNNYRRKNGEIFPAETIGTQFRDDSGNILGFVGIMRDVSKDLEKENEKKRLEDQLIHAQKMESIGRLAGGIAHDFNNVLTSIMGYAEMLKLKFQGTESSSEKAAHIILENAERAADLTKQLLGFARKGKHNPEPVRINDIIKETVLVSEKIFEKRISVKYNFKNDVATIEADKHQLAQVLTNLIINAKDAMPEGGELTFSTRNKYLDNSFYCSCGEFYPGSYVELTVSDTGIGIPPEIMDKIFEPFYTTKGEGKGTGLGLAMVFGIVVNHGGHLKVNSEPGTGTEFNLYFPVSGKETAYEIQAEHVYKGSGTILLVDDEEAIRDISVTMLKELGYSIVTASDGIEAVKLYENNKDEIDLVILDMIMPEMAGRETNLELRRINPDVKVLLASGFSEEGEAKTILSEGALDFIQKPFRINELSKTISEIMRN